MTAKIPAHVREKQINELPNIRFVRWADEYRNSKSKAICLCSIDGYEWTVRVNDLVCGKGCPQCAGVRRWTADERIDQINATKNLSFVRWVGAYKNCESKAVCRCSVDGFEWESNVSSLLKGHGCPSCAGNRRWTAEERISQINAIQGVLFVRWTHQYRGAKTKAECRCSLGHEWIAPIDCLINGGTGCPKCAHNRTHTPEERKLQIEGLKGVRFIKWVNNYANNLSKAVCRCDAGHEWSASVNSLVNKGQGCPVCAVSGFDKTKTSALYALRSECGTMVKIGISNDYEQRHRKLARSTPFGWNCIELLHGDGSLIADLEKELHRKTEQVQFPEKFDGHTEWRRWDSRLPLWFENYRRNIDAQ